MIERPTLRERMAVIETKIDNHIHHHEVRDRWMLCIVGGLVVGVILLAVPVFWGWLSELGGGV